MYVCVCLFVRNQLYPLEKVKSMVDFGADFESNLTFRDHISEKINKNYSVLGIIKRNFIYMDEHTFILLYKAMVCAHVEFANSVLCPFSQDSRLGEGCGL